MKLKDYYDKDCAELIGEKIQKVNHEFDKEVFVTYIDSHISGKEFIQRQDIFVDGFDMFLPGNFYDHIDVFRKILGPELTKSEGMFNKGWWLWPVGRYIERHGSGYINESLDFIYELTKRHTGEFAIRPLLEADSLLVLGRMYVWSKDTNVHVRRLASEGLRTRLPWAKKTFAAVEHIDLYKSILTNLKDDQNKFVQKSVGNNLNDLMKDRPYQVFDIIDEWQKETTTKACEWIIKHGLRNGKKLLFKQYTTIDDDDVLKVYKSYPYKVLEKTLMLRELVLNTGLELDFFEEIEETLKWEEPSYIPRKPKTGTTLRIAWKPKKQEYYGIYVNCKTTLIESFQVLHPNSFKYEGNRAILLPIDENVLDNQGQRQLLRQFIIMTFEYHIKER